jgi:flagellar basal body-associated protein FliL
MSKKVLWLIILIVLFLIICSTLGYYFIGSTSKVTDTKETNKSEKGTSKSKEIPLEKPPFIKD